MRERQQWADGIITAFVWVGFIIFALMMFDCAVATFKNGTSIF